MVFPQKLGLPLVSAKQKKILTQQKIAALCSLAVVGFPQQGTVVVVASHKAGNFRIPTRQLAAIPRPPHSRLQFCGLPLRFCGSVFLPVRLLHFGGHTVQLAVILAQRCLGKARVKPINTNIALGVFVANGHMLHARAVLDRVTHTLQFGNKTVKAVGGCNGLFHILADHAAYGGLAGLTA